MSRVVAMDGNLLENLKLNDNQKKMCNTYEQLTFIDLHHEMAESIVS